MSAVFHVVLTTAPGVALVPKPAFPVFHGASLNVGWGQSSAGLSVVYFHVAGCVRASGISVVTCGGLGIAAHGPALNASRPAHFFQICSSASTLTKMPPITGRACMPPLLTLLV